ncbi:hypothetical protein G647_00276 [Cladophialophora carrionii CBS 160.54]|uniref:Heterokaryon incompatibility domain-containing protein n=1 Tax=Cladophialophora carrionii CBS 160.54 TaxID=1279043 RepID=V9DPE0_9EURO|nr:uncharacterized protein G647_00276 [Cladophialophora carrionii CBS 160.54]ETI27827.1 hypothetical protein G647_00276 [Cladophialophora carrionii CBS 160.54]
MAVLYESAELTIIAAAGDGADYGLPGVPSRHRLEQRCIQVGGHDYIVFDTPLNSALQDSRYITRGWTYQEEASSVRLRRLYFTDHQIYFECRESHSCEIVVAADRLLRFMKERGNRVSKVDPTDIDKGNAAWHHIGAVFERTLTDESDDLGHQTSKLLLWSSDIKNFLVKMIAHIEGHTDARTDRRTGKAV